MASALLSVPDRAAALQALRAAAASCGRNRAGFTDSERAAGLAIAEYLRTCFSAAPLQTGEAGQEPAPQSLLERLPAEVPLAVLRQAGTRELARLATTCRLFYSDLPRPVTVIEEALRQRAAARGSSIPRCLPPHASGWVPWLLRRESLAVAQLTVAAGVSHSVFVDGDGMLVGWLYAGFQAPAVPSPHLFRSQPDVRYQSVTCSASYVLALSDEGGVDLWCTDANDPDEEEVLDDSEYHYRVTRLPTRVAGLQGNVVVGVAASSLHCAALTSTGQLFTWGYRGPRGELPSGLGYPVKPNSFAQGAARRVRGALNGVQLSSVAAGEGFTLVCSRDGHVFSFGDSHNNRLGHNEHIAGGQVLPKRVQALSPAEGTAVKAVSAGICSGMALTSDGNLYHVRTPARTR